MENIPTNQTEDSVFSINHLFVNYGEKTVIKDIALDIPRHSVIALIGPSGCGKSTFLRCLNRMNDLIPEAKITGEIKFEGREIAELPVIGLRTRVGMVFQNPNPFPMTVFDNIAYGPRCQGIKQKNRLNEIVINALKKAALYEEVKDRLKDSAMSLSGGQKQRLCIARAIAMEPEVILMDEPTSALDPIATQKIEDLISVLRDEYTIVIVTHNMAQAARISDYTAFFLLGEIIEYDHTNAIFNNPSNPKTAAYIGGRFG